MPAPRGVVALLASFLVAAATMAATLPLELAAAGSAWPPSSGLVLAEVMTGGVSASDEYVEIANAGAMAEDLGGCELVYVTASGTTVTRKASFAGPLLLVPGGHLLVANSAGIYGPLADSTYSGGLAADGGSLALRRVDGTVVDAVGWGTAANSYVEGTAAPAPPAKSSLERLPGGSGGNTQDTNDNRADWFVQANPVPQSLKSTPVPGPSMTATPEPTGTPTPSPTPAPTGTPAPSPTPGQTGTPTPTSTPEPTGPPEPTGTLTPSPASTPTATPTPIGTPSAPPTPTATRSQQPTASPPAPSSSTEPTPQLETIAAARAEAVGSRVHVAGIVTVGPGLVGADGLFAIEDSSGGIFVRLSTTAEGLAVGRPIEIDGTLAAPYGQLEIRNLGMLVVGTDDREPSPNLVELSDVGEQTEGSLVTVRGTVDSVETDSGRLTIELGDGTSVVRVLADPPTGLSKSDVVRGDVVVVAGIVGQHATATGRLDGYRVWLRRRSDLAVDPPTVTEPPNPPSAPTEEPVHRDLASALGTRGATVDVEAAVTATTGLLDLGNPTIVVDDGTAAVAVILPDATDAPPVGMRVRITGKVGRWEGGPTVIASQVTAEGELQAIAPRPVAGSLDGSVEWQLVRVCGRIDKYTRAGARWRLDMLVDGHPVVILGAPAAAVDVAKDSVGRLAVVGGSVRRSTSDSSAFQLLPRMSLDFRLGPPPTTLGAGVAAGSARASGAGDSSAGAGDRGVEIGSLADYLGQNVTVAGLVTDTATGTATIDDGTGEVRIGGPSAADALAMLEPGDAIEVTGQVGQDDLGLIIEVNPASVIDMPGDGLDARASQGPGGGLMVAASTPVSAASLAAAIAMRRSSPAALPPDGIAILAVIIVLLAVVALALTVFVAVAPDSAPASVLARRCGSLRRFRLMTPSQSSAIVARLTLPWRRRGRDDGHGEGREDGRQEGQVRG